MRDAFAVVAKSETLRHLSWAEKKAMILLVALEGDWNGAAALADALGVEADDQETIWRESRRGA